MGRGDKAPQAGLAARVLGACARLLARCRPVGAPDTPGGRAADAERRAGVLRSEVRVQPGGNGPLELLAGVLEGAGLPNGVVELVIEDAQQPARCTLDIHEGRVSVVAPGSTVPWASISGSGRAWERALGPARDVSQLSHTGEPALTQRVMAALGGHRSLASERAGNYSVLDCS